MSLFSNNNFSYRIYILVSIHVFIDVVIFENVQYIDSRDMKIKMISASCIICARRLTGYKCLAYKF